MRGCDPRLKQLAFRAIEITPVDFGIPATGGSRTAIIQNGLHLMGRSKCDGYVKKSKHQIKEGETFCKALDFFGYVKGHGVSYAHEHMALIATAFLQSAIELGYKIEWGGLWLSFKDLPHIQLVEGD